MQTGFCGPCLEALEQQLLRPIKPLVDPIVDAVSLVAIPVLLPMARLGELLLGVACFTASKTYYDDYREERTAGYAGRATFKALLAATTLALSAKLVIDAVEGQSWDNFFGFSRNNLHRNLDDLSQTLGLTT